MLSNGQDKSYFGEEKKRRWTRFVEQYGILYGELEELINLKFYPFKSYSIRFLHLLLREMVEPEPKEY